MSNPKRPSSAQKAINDFSPKLVGLTDNVLFGDILERRALSPRDRSLIAVVTSLVTGRDTGQLSFHINYAKQNGLTEEEIIETITHLAFYAGWPNATSAYTVTKKVFAKEQ
ncbi:carboxymuconolactone decarboxylase family protein [Paenibacillus sp. BR2-3]|uniref:carboxymuconolactone decarboxylase family protein n=1 Tax=Paenibacillus sp. BR2-3 TaxID=3048494 RepID=UPI003977A529